MFLVHIFKYGSMCTRCVFYSQKTQTHTHSIHNENKISTKKNTRQVITPSKLNFCHFHSIYCCFSFVFRMKNHFCFILFVSYTFFALVAATKFLFAHSRRAFSIVTIEYMHVPFFFTSTCCIELLLQFLISIFSANKYYQRTKF